jgi:threonine dehydratase
MSDPITYADVLRAQQRVRRHLAATPLYEWPGLSRRLGCRFFLKHENHQPTGAFKVRGGINLVAALSPEEQRRGLIAVSTGNHGQSLAFACRCYGVALRIVVPQRNNPDKLRAIRGWGAEIIEHGSDFDAARLHCEALAQEHGWRYVHSANEPLLIAGVATCALEILQQVPQPDVLLVPIGLGSGASGAALVAAWRSPRTRVIGVQARGAPAVALSWQRGEMVQTPAAATWAEGMATRVPASMTLDILRRHLSDVVLVDEGELYAAVHLGLHETHNLLEGAGAAAVAAALQLGAALHGRTVVAVASGGNLDLRELPRVLQAPLP